MKSLVESILNESKIYFNENDLPRPLYTHLAGPTHHRKEWLKIINDWAEISDNHPRYYQLSKKNTAMNIWLPIILNAHEKYDDDILLDYFTDKQQEADEFLAIIGEPSYGKNYMDIIFDDIEDYNKKKRK